PQDLLPSWAVMPQQADVEVEMADDIPQEQRMPDGFFDTWLQGVVIITTPSPVEGELAQFETSKAEAIRQLSRSGRNQLVPTDAAGEVITVNAEVVENKASSSQELTGAMVKQLRQEAGLSQMDLAIAVGMSQSWVRNIENKWQDKPLKLVHAERIQNILKIPH
ncbi:helix-turn-helix domain-containing protein, partial [Leptolyngbya sp. FACHB-671]|uniref:helix-turn-helix domain-containing protein n=1 Tax=Leptolyngbya sp. FACHB-671 TaxID=2692812 RepID=UPI0016844461